MKKFFIAVLGIAVAAMVGYGINYAVSPLKTQKLAYITQENAINTNGFIIRDEWVMYTRSAGTAYHSVSEGCRVSKDSDIGSLFYGDVSEDSIKELAVVDNKIKKAMAEESAKSLSDTDETNVESNIHRIENSIVDAAEKNDVITVAQYKNNINALRSNSDRAEGSLAQLEIEKQQILNNIGVGKDDVYAQIAGVFTAYVDGYETSLVPADIESYDVAYFESLSQSPKMRKINSKVDAGGEVCKIVNNHVWYVMMSIPKETVNGRSVGDAVKLRFNNIADSVVNATIYHMSEEEGDRTLVTVKCTDYLESAFSYRFVDVDLIFESFNGYKIPIHAIRTEDSGKQKVIGINGNRQFDCYCDVLFTNTDGGYAIVDTADGAENKLSQMQKIIIGER